MTTNANFMKRIMHLLTDALERSAQQRTRQYLLGLSNGHLEDMGLSRELIKQGPKAWPWRTADEPLGAPGLAAAMRQRSTDSGAQPADHDGTRRRIEQAVGFNHPGTDTKLAA